MAYDCFCEFIVEIALDVVSENNRNYYGFSRAYFPENALILTYT